MLRLVVLVLLAISMSPAFAQQTGVMPTVNDGDFAVERFVSGIPNSPATMAFVGDDILVLQKNFKP